MFVMARPPGLIRVLFTLKARMRVRRVGRVPTLPHLMVLVPIVLLVLDECTIPVQIVDQVLGSIVRQKGAQKEFLNIHDCVE